MIIIVLFSKEKKFFHITPNEKRKEEIYKRIENEMNWINSIEEAEEEIKVLKNKASFNEDTFYIEEKIKKIEEYIINFSKE